MIEPLKMKIHLVGIGSNYQFFEDFLNLPCIASDPSHLNVV